MSEKEKTVNWGARATFRVPEYNLGWFLTKLDDVIREVAGAYDAEIISLETEDDREDE